MNLKNNYNKFLSIHHLFWNIFSNAWNVFILKRFLNWNVIGTHQKQKALTLLIRSWHIYWKTIYWSASKIRASAIFLITTVRNSNVFCLFKLYLCTEWRCHKDTNPFILVSDKSLLQKLKCIPPFINLYVPDLWGFTWLHESKAIHFAFSQCVPYSLSANSLLSLFKCVAFRGDTGLHPENDCWHFTDTH